MRVTSYIQSGLSFFLLCFVLSSCAVGTNTSNKYFPVKNTKIRASTLGFSIKPPSGGNWYEKLNDNTLYYLKRLQSKNYAIYTKASEIELDGEGILGRDMFVEFVKHKKKLNDAAGEYRNVSFQYAFDSALSPLCVRYTQKYDYIDSGRKDDREYIRVKNRGLVCMHPDIPGKGIDMYYVESSLASRSAGEESYRDEAESFLSSLRFN